MFIHDSHLPQLLKPEQYHSQTQHDLEMQRLFMPSWHGVASLGELPKVGDYITRTILGRPIILWRDATGVRAYLNVCAHRFCEVVSCAKGNGERITCPYHGWEYDSHGQTKKIPDAQSFKPMPEQRLGLKEYKCELFEQLIFVNFSENPPPLREQLGEVANKITGWFDTEHWRHLFTRVYTHECNWKGVIENAIEGYHVNTVHAKTFNYFTPEHGCFHELGNNWSLYGDYPYPAPKGFMSRIWHRLVTSAGYPKDFGLRHISSYPHNTFASLGFITIAQLIYPASPTTATGVMIVYGMSAKSLSHRLILARDVRKREKLIQKVVSEDMGIQPNHQRGLNAGDRPNDGFISKREERLYHFQQFVSKYTAD